jgi:WD40 repeat protein
MPRLVPVWFINSLLLACLAWNGSSVLSFAATPHIPVTALQFSPDGSSLLAAAYKEILVRSIHDGKSQQRLKCDLSKITAIGFSPEGRFLAVAGGNSGESGSVHLFDWSKAKAARDGANSDSLVQSPAPALTLSDFDDLVTSISFSPDGTRLAVASADHSVQVFTFSNEAAKAVLTYTLTDHSGPVLAVGFTRDGHTLVSTSADRSIKVWDMGNGKLLRTFSNHTAIVHCLALRPGSVESDKTGPVFCATGSDDKTVRVWQPEIGRMVRIVRQHEGPILALAYARDGARLFSAGGEGIVRVIDADSDAILQQWRASEDWIYSLALSPDGRMLASGDWAGGVKLWDVQAETIRAVW